MGKTNKKKLFREHYYPDVLFILANTDKILENSEN